MNKKLRAGKSSELTVAGELIRQGLDVYIPCVDDQSIDLIIRVKKPRRVVFYDAQVKSVRGYNRIVGVCNPRRQGGNYLLIIHYRHDNKPDEFFYLNKKQIERYYLEGSEWGDLIFKKADREKLKHQNLINLAESLHG
jgi:hypothetical protein